MLGHLLPICLNLCFIPQRDIDPNRFLCRCHFFNDVRRSGDPSVVLPGPFIFAFYPELLLIDEAIRDPRSSAGGYLPRYDGSFHMTGFLLLIGRLVVALYLISSALSGFDRTKLANWEIVLRLGLAVLLLMKVELIWIGAAVATVALLLPHGRMGRHSQVA